MTSFNINNYNNEQITIIEDIIEKCENNSLPLHLLFEKADNENDKELLKKIYDIDIFRDYCNHHYNLTKSVFDYPNWKSIIELKN